MRGSVKAIITRLEVVIESVEEYKCNAEDAEHPNDERIERLEEELERLEEARDALESIE